MQLHHASWQRWWRAVLRRASRAPDLPRMESVSVDMALMSSLVLLSPFMLPCGVLASSAMMAERLS